MDEKVVTAIHELANALAGLGSWQQQLVSMAVLLVVAAGGSFFGAYLKTRATNAAMADDLDEIKRQLRETTDTAETIRAQIGKRSEYNTLRIKKLEELMEAFLVALTSYRDAFQSLFKEGHASSDIVAPQHALMLAKFYFPEHEEGLRVFADKWRLCVIRMYVDRIEVLRQHDAVSDEWRLVRLAALADPSLEHDAERESAVLDRQLVTSMRKLLGEAEPEEAGHAPA
ncbi:hypothetical protein [Achromobacter animicus]|uniref:hypothetical protein n=1 Tax=Achromobacter animicus TaxID=1389935 RepID=UPI0028B09670|nr:hypothetical protein [Achromobacter animicus]